MGNARHPEGNSYSYEDESPPVDVLHSPKLGLTNMDVIYSDLSENDAAPGGAP